MPAQPSAFFLDADGDRKGQRFCLLHRPTAGVRAAMVHVHAFAEEMNKSRRMVAEAARLLAEDGVAVLQIDLLGCGDSSGDLADASWDEWIADVRQAARWLDAEFDAPLWFWGLRAGSLLASAASVAHPGAGHLFWQPAIAGKPLLQQFLRLKAASEMQGGGAKGVTDGLRQELAAGRPVEVAGYALPAAVAMGMESALLSPPENSPGARMVWLEVSSRQPPEMLPTSAGAISRWQAAGHVTQSEVVAGPAFWQTTEIETAPELLQATRRALRQEALA